MTTQAYPPWHMWGNSQVLTMISVGNAAQLRQTNQIARVSYKRPDTWSFFLGARIIQSPLGNPEEANVILDFDLIIGIGRTSFLTKNENSAPFHQFRWVVPAGVSGAGQAPRFVTTTEANNFGGADLIINDFPAQDIQCEVSASVSSILPLAAGEWRIEAHAFFAPKTHIRPDWLAQDVDDEELNERRFRGNETEGT